LALLSSRFELYDIRDVEAFAISIIDRSELRLSHHDREDLLDSLIVACWKCSLDYDPARACFSTFATYKVRAELVAWLRTSNERTGRTGFRAGGQNGSSTIAPTSASCLSSSHSTVETTATLLLNWEALSEEGAWITTHIAFR
jgi:hypothetical protein